MKSGYFAPEQTEAELDTSHLDAHAIEPVEIDLDLPGLGPLKSYFEQLEADAHACFQLATQARQRGFDPALEPEIPFAEDLASRVEALVGPEGVADRIRELKGEMGREELALLISKEVAAGSFCTYEGPEQALDGAIRTGLAILTEGILVAPLEGVAYVKVRANDDGTEYADVYFAGPIRAAGGTGQALSVLIADVVRRELGLSTYKATKAEVERFKEEIPAYKRAANLQYTPGPDEIELIVNNLPVGVNGEGTEQEEVSGYRDLPRVETNALRGGACLVLAEGLTLKAPKILKHVDKLGLEGWEFLEDHHKLIKGDDDSEDGQGGTKGPKIQPINKFIQELTAGRPVFSHPMAPGGFRLRYGRARTAGLASTAIHPALTTLVDDFLATGTQLKVERPGKGTIVTPCDALEPPIVRLKSGDVVEVTSCEHAAEIRAKVDSILDLGEMLVPFGEFLENNKRLPASAWCPEWWARLLEENGHDVPDISDAQATRAFELAEQTDTPLHPRFTLFWHDLTPSELTTLHQALETARLEGDRLVLPADSPAKPVLETLGATHALRSSNGTGEIVVDARCSLPVIRGAGYRVQAGSLSKHAAPPAASEIEDVVHAASQLSGVQLKAKCSCRIGARMGRPEKAAERKMSPPVHTLFPIGGSGGMQRLIKQAAAQGTIGDESTHGFDAIEVGIRACQGCGTETLHLDCPECSQRTYVVDGRPRSRKLPIAELVQHALERLGEPKLYPSTKGVRGLISELKIPEPLEKGILRSKYDLSVFKDGTCRHDMTDLPLTHFRPREIGTDVETLSKLGYTEDIHGAPLESPEQLLELRPQDIVINEGALEYMARVATFVDDLLARFYGIQPFYDLDEPRDLVGHLAVGLAPHTSGGVLCRIIGTTRAAGHWGHPFFHAAKRRNADGDEDCIMLLLDGLLNFSRSYLPDRRGGQMDAPLTLSIRIDPNEIDKEAHNIECVEAYPLAFYEATETNPGPKEIEDLVEVVADRLDSDDKYTGLAFSHDSASMDEGPLLSAYKTIDTMLEKMEGQLSLAKRIRAVDAGDVASRVICDHFLPDIIGNLKAFSRQTVRCAKCNTKYRRVPLTGRCGKCKNTLTMTVHEASVKKYIEVSKRVSQNYPVNEYTHQRLTLAEEAIESLFQNDKVKKATLSDFL